MTNCFVELVSYVDSPDGSAHGEHIDIGLSPRLAFVGPNAAAEFFESLAGPDPNDPCRKYANRLRAVGPIVDRRVSNAVQKDRERTADRTTEVDA